MGERERVEILKMMCDKEKSKKLLLKYHLPLGLFAGVLFGYLVPAPGEFLSDLDSGFYGMVRNTQKSLSYDVYNRRRDSFLQKWITISTLSLSLSF